MPAPVIRYMYYYSLSVSGRELERPRKHGGWFRMRIDLVLRKYTNITSAGLFVFLFDRTPNRQAVCIAKIRISVVSHCLSPSGLHYANMPMFSLRFKTVNVIIFE